MSILLIFNSISQFYQLLLFCNILIRYQGIFNFIFRLLTFVFDARETESNKNKILAKFNQLSKRKSILQGE
jgi:hypothetical protein